MAWSTSIPWGGGKGSPPSTSTKPETRSGNRRTSAAATKPPIEWPTSTTGPAAEAVISPATSSACRSIPTAPASYGWLPDPEDRGQQPVSGKRLGQQCEGAVVGGDPVHGDDSRSAGRIPLSAVQQATVDRCTDRPVGCSLRCPTAVHGVGGTGDHGRIRTDQPADQGRDFRLDQTLDGVVRQHDRFQHRRLREPVSSGLVGDLLLHQRVRT